MSLFSKQIDKRIAAYQRELIETHYQEVDNMYRKMRGWRHDYRNHIQTMKAYAAAGRSGKGIQGDQAVQRQENRIVSASGGQDRSSL